MTEYLTIPDAAAALRAGEVTSVELVQAAINAADSWEPELGAFITRYVDSSLEAASRADTALAAGEPVGPLHGIPLGIKDIITTSEGPTTGQSVAHDTAAMTGDAVVVARLRAAGGIVTGKTSTMEFACGMPDASKPFPIPRNPWNLDTWPGGSSSGTGAGVAAGLFLAGLGTDTGGSIRIPSAFCGITGLMPTFGRVPKSGCIPLGYSLDHIGPMARSARDCALMLSVLAGHDPSDLCSIDEPVPNYLDALTGELSGLRIGYDRLARAAGKLADPALADVFDAALSEFEALGASVVEIELPFYREMGAADIVILLSEALAYHLPDLQARWDDYGAGTRNTIASAIFYSAADYVQAQRARRVGHKALAAAYSDVDVIVTPTVSTGAPSFATMKTLSERVSGGEGTRALHTGYWNCTGHPVLSVPVGMSTQGLPLGIQIAGRPFDEATVLRAGDAYQSRTNWHLAVPPIAAMPTDAISTNAV